MNKRWIQLATVFVLFGVLSITAFSNCHASQRYSQKTGKKCIYCHRQNAGGQLNTMSYTYIRNGYCYPINAHLLNKTATIQSWPYKILRFIFRYLHILVGIIFLGNIIHTHIFTDPTLLKFDFSSVESKVRLSCLGGLVITGCYLTWIRLDRFEYFFNNIFGIILFVKILLSMLLAISILGVTIIVSKHRKAKTDMGENVSSGNEKVSRDELAQSDGRNGKPGYILFHGRVYDVSDSAYWKAGSHMGQHTAGADLTEAIKGAPHGATVLGRLPCLGVIAPYTAVPAVENLNSTIITNHVAFKVLVYSNLVLVGFIILCVAFWHWDLPI